MAGKIKKIIDYIIDQKSDDNQALINLNRAKFMLKGINPDHYNSSSDDDPRILSILRDLARSLKIDIRVNIFSTYTQNPNLDEAVEEIKHKFEYLELSFLLYFASPLYNPELLAKQMHECFDGVQTFGCTTAGEITTGKVLKNSIVAMGITKDVIKDFKVEVVDLNDPKSTLKALDSFEKYFGVPIHKMNYDEYLGLILIDGLSKKEEKIMEELGDYTNFLFVGGAAGDYMNFESTFVFANGKSYSNSAILVLLKPNIKFEVIKTQSFKLTDKKLIATKIDNNKRIVKEFNNRPAALVYSEALGVEINNLPNMFTDNPLGLVLDEEVYVRSPQQVVNNSVVFYSNINEGDVLTILDPTDIIKDTQESINNLFKKYPQISGLIHFNCILRAQELENHNIVKDYEDIFKDIQTIGFNTFGEEFIGHLNQTSTFIVFV